MIVTDRAAQRQSHENRGHRLGAVNGVAHQNFVVDGTAFAGRHVATVESGGDALFDGRFGEQVAGKLLDRELIESLVLVEGVDDPLAILPQRAFVVEMQAVRVAIPHQVEPITRHVFAESFRLEQPIDHAFVRTRLVVVQERIDLGRRRRQAGQIERRAADQRRFLRWS